MAAGLAEVVSGETRPSVKTVRQASKCMSTTLLSEWKLLCCDSGVPGATGTAGSAGTESSCLGARSANKTSESNRGRLQRALNRPNTDKIKS